MARFGLYAPSSLIWGRGGAFLFHFILSKIVHEPLLGVTSSIWGNHDTKSALVRTKVTSSEYLRVDCNYFHKLYLRLKQEAYKMRT